MPHPAGDPTPSADEIRHWLTTRLAELLGIRPDEVSADEPLAGMELDSMQFVALVGELEDHLGCRFQDNPLFDYPTIASLAGFLARELAEGHTLINPARRIDS